MIPTEVTEGALVYLFNTKSKRMNPDVTYRITRNDADKLWYSDGNAYYVCLSIILDRGLVIRNGAWNMDHAKVVENDDDPD